MLVASSKVIKIGSEIMVALPEHIVSKIMLYVTHHPVAMMYNANRNVYGQIANEKCSWRGYCACDECHHMRSVSKAELLYLVTKPSNKLEKILELKVIMNWVIKKVGSHDVNPDLSTEKRIIYHRWLWQELQKSDPMFCHCNKDLNYNCLVIMIRNINFELCNYDDLYDQFFKED